MYTVENFFAVRWTYFEAVEQSGALAEGAVEAVEEVSVHDAQVVVLDEHESFFAVVRAVCDGDQLLQQSDVDGVLGGFERLRCLCEGVSKQEWRLARSDVCEEEVAADVVVDVCVQQSRPEALDPALHLLLVDLALCG